MAESTKVSFVETPDGKEADIEQSTTARIDVGVRDETIDYRAEITAQLYVDGAKVDEKVSDNHLQDDSFTRTLRNTFDGKGIYNIRVFIGIDWYIPNDSGVNKSDSFDDSVEISRGIEIVERSFTADSTTAQTTGYKDAFNNRVPVFFDSIEADETVGANVPDTIEFTPNDNPDITVDTSGRFATHDIIGGVTVRQKIGENAVEIGVSGVCDEDTAQQIDQLRNAKVADFISDRISMTVQIASTSTDPLESGGAADMNSGDLLYSYTMNLVGIEDIVRD